MIFSVNCYCQDSREYFRQAEIKYDHKDYAGAISELNKFIDININYYKGYLFRGVVKSNLNDYRGAIADYDKAIKNNFACGDAYSCRGKAYSNLGNYIKAIEDFTQAMVFSQDSENYLLRGYCKAKLNDYRGAIDDYTAAIKRNPQNAKAYYRRGILRINNDMKDIGCLDLSKAGELGYTKAYDDIKQYCQ